MAQAARQWRRCVDQRMQPYGLTLATWLPLRQLVYLPSPVSQQELAKALSLTGPSLVRLLDSLQQQGLIERRQGSDRRVNEIYLTEAGKEMAEHVEEVSQQVSQRVLSMVEPEQVKMARLVILQVMSELEDMEQEFGNDE